MTKEKAELKERLAVARMRDRSYVVRNQIQNDIRTFMDGCVADLNDTNKTDIICQIVTDNFEQMNCNNIN
jgi:hypothetical protein|tara:strand:+ start:40 stop:249 length:210 start_codon:yes stop_codon:yes gene_type:complete